MGLIDGDDFVTGDFLSFQEGNRLKNHWIQSDPQANLSNPQAGMIVYDSDDGNLYLRQAAAYAEILTGADSDEKVKVDAAAVAGYLGAAFNDGVLRTGLSLTYADGGNFVTIDTIQDIRTSAAVSFTGITDTETAATNLAAGTIGERPAGIVGDIRYNSTLGVFEVYTGAWENVGDVTAAAALADHTLLRGDGGVKGIQDSGIDIDDADNITFPDGASINLQEDITFLGATTENLIKFPDNLPDAFSFMEGANPYQTFVSTNGSEGINLFKTITLGSIPAGVADYDKFLVSDTGIVKFRTGAEVLADIGAGAGDVTAGANIDANAVVIGDDGAKGVKKSTMLVSDAGEMTNPSQPAFLAALQVNDPGVTGGGTLYRVGDDTDLVEKFDQANNFDPTTGIFTAPITGKYIFACNVSVYGLTVHTLLLQFTTSNRAYRLVYLETTDIHKVGRCSFSGSQVVDMDINDTAYLSVNCDGGAAGTVSLEGDGTMMVTALSGAMIC